MYPLPFNENQENIINNKANIVSVSLLCCTFAHFAQSLKLMTATKPEVSKSQQNTCFVIILNCTDITQIFILLCS